MPSHLLWYQWFQYRNPRVEVDTYTFWLIYMLSQKWNEVRLEQEVNRNIFEWLITILQVVVVAAASVSRS